MVEAKQMPWRWLALCVLSAVPLSVLHSLVYFTSVDRDHVTTTCLTFRRITKRGRAGGEREPAGRGPASNSTLGQCIWPSIIAPSSGARTTWQDQGESDPPYSWFVWNRIQLCHATSAWENPTWAEHVGVTSPATRSRHIVIASSSARIRGRPLVAQVF